MTTISTTSSTPSAVSPTKSAASVSKSAVNSLLTSLGSGSGVDTDTLVTQLVDAQFAPKKAMLTSRYDKLTAQISGASSLKSTITDFAKAVDGLVTGGTLATQPTSSNASVATTTVVPGSTLSGTTTSTVKVNALATAQNAMTGKIASPASTTFGSGTLTLKLGTATYAGSTMSGFTTGKNTDGSDQSFAITIDPPNNTLSGIASAINAQKSGVTASVVTDADGGAYLALKGQTGTAQAFTLTADDPAGALAAFDTGFNASASSQMTIAGKATNAKLEMDGVPVERGSNDVTDLVPGVKLALTGTGTTTVGATRPDTEITNAVKDFVDTYNSVLAVVKEQTDPVNGPLRADPAAKALLRSLQGLSNRTLLPDQPAGGLSTLASIGVRTNQKTGMLEVDSTVLSRTVKEQPETVQAMFAPNVLPNTGLNSAMKSLQLSSSSTIYGLGKSTSGYNDAQKEITKQQSKIDDQATRLTTRMTQQFSSMNARVSAYKATQSFMKQQIDSWTKSSD